MISIEIKNIPYQLPHHSGMAMQRKLTMAILDKMFRDCKSILTIRSSCTEAGNVKIVEGGALDATLYRIHEDLDMWATIQPGDNNCVIVLIHFHRYMHFAEENMEFVICRFVRALRNYCEDFHEHYSKLAESKFMKPEISSFSLPDDLVASSIDDELKKAMVVTEGFATRNFVMSDPGEPFFVLLGRDPQAPDLLRNWADLRECCHVDDSRKISEARVIADKMELFKEANPKRGMSVEQYEEGYQSQQRQQNDD